MSHMVAHYLLQLDPTGRELVVFRGNVAVLPPCIPTCAAVPGICSHTTCCCRLLLSAAAKKYSRLAVAPRTFFANTWPEPLKLTLQFRDAESPDGRWATAVR